MAFVNKYQASAAVKMFTDIRLHIKACKLFNGLIDGFDMQQAIIDDFCCNMNANYLFFDFNQFGRTLKCDIGRKYTT